MNQFHPYTKLILLIAVAIFASCSRSKSTQGGDYIDINNIEKVSFYDVYDSIEIIPLETTEESILIYRQTKPAKMVLHDDKFYILDENKIFIFDSNGKYISKINKQGRGRGEYSEISDFNINMFTGDIEILSPTGVINIYDKNSLEYRQKIEIQTSNNAYHAFHCLTEDIYILYSAYSEDRQILLYSISKAELIGDTYHAPTWLPQAGLSYSTSPFYTIGESLCFVQAYDGQVFNLGEQPPYINTKYQWDFGRATINIDNIPPDRDYKFYLDVSS
ncbi:MAG: 6-bladed beta-propeller [Rikenellaceae bacterium]